MWQIVGVPLPPGLRSSLYTGDALNVGGVVGLFLAFAIVGAGLFFFVKLISAGFTFLTSFGDSAKIQAATKELTNATVGLLVVICAFFLAQILQVVLGVTIL